MRPQRVGILADDLTGACDTALQFLFGGVGGQPNDDVWILPELSSRAAIPAGASVVALNVDSRHLLPAEAAARVDKAARQLRAAGCTRFYKKIDSTLRGNLTAEILQAMHTLGLELAVIAPAFPQAGRLTVGGYQLVDGLPVNASPYARDPVTPVKHSHLPTLLREEGGGPVATLDLKDVMSGPEAVAAAIVRAVSERKRILVADAARAEDLAVIARGIVVTPYRVLPVGSAGLARALQPHHILDAASRQPHPSTLPVLLGARPPVLLVAGSLNPVTRRQVEAMRKTARIVQVDVAGLLLEASNAPDQLVRTVRQHLLNRHDVVISTALDDEALRKSWELGRNLGLGPRQVGAHLSATIGQVVAKLVGAVPLAGLILAGGDTALGVCRALGAPAMRVQDELLPAIPLCRAELPGGTSLRIVTKSGGFGAPDALLELTERLRRSASGD